MNTYVFQHVKTGQKVTIHANNLLTATNEAYKVYGDYNFLLISTNGKKHINR